MSIIARYREWGRARAERLEKIKEEKESLIEVLVPYKIQSYETPYYTKGEVVDSEIRLRELDMEEQRIRGRGILRGICSYFFA